MMDGVAARCSAMVEREEDYELQGVMGKCENVGRERRREMCIVFGWDLSGCAQVVRSAYLRLQA